MMHYGSIHFADVANGPGMRISLFVSGCTHHCKGCFNPQTWDFEFGAPFEPRVEDKIIRWLSQDRYDGLTLLGGEPMELRNQAHLYSLISRAHDLGKNIWVYTGYTWEELRDAKNKRCHGPKTDRILEKIDVLVDGEFVEEKRNISLAFRGSENQRIIDVQKSLRKDGAPVLLW